MKKLLAAVAVVGCCTSAFAADLPVRAAPPVYVPPVPVLTWTGPYLGVTAGGVVSRSSSSSFVAAPIDNNGAPGGASPASAQSVQNQQDNAVTSNIRTGGTAGAALGGEVGYNYQLSRAFVVGAELDVQGFVTGRDVGTIAPVTPVDPFGGTVGGSAFFANDTVSKRVDGLVTVRGRLGYLVTPTVLVFGTGGFAAGAVSSNTFVSVDRDRAGSNSTGFIGRFKGVRTGYAVGGGVEWKFAPNLSLKAEYLHYDLGSAGYPTTVNVETSAATGLLATDSGRTRVRFSGDIARIGLNYHFSSPVPVVARY